MCSILVIVSFQLSLPVFGLGSWLLKGKCTSFRLSVFFDRKGVFCHLEPVIVFCAEKFGLSPSFRQIASKFTSEELSWFLEQLKALKEFMDRNSQFTSPIMAER